MHAGPAYSYACQHCPPAWALSQCDSDVLLTMRPAFAPGELSLCAAAGSGLPSAHAVCRHFAATG